MIVTGKMGRLFYCHTQNEDIKYFRWGFVSDNNVLMLSELVAATRHSSRNFAHAFVGKTIVWSVDNMFDNCRVTMPKS